MPALRKFLKNFFPRCFGTTEDNSNYKNYDTPEPNKLSSGKGTGARRLKPSHPSGGPSIIQETKIEIRRHEDDEIQLVDMQQGKRTCWQSEASDKASDGSRNGTQTTLDIGSWR